VLLALLWLVFVGVSVAAAEARGRRVVEGLLLGLFLGPVGMLIESLLPAKRGDTATPAKEGPSDAAAAADHPLSPWLFAAIVLAVGALLALGLGVFWLRY
jgi:hypothetical protein